MKNPFAFLLLFSSFLFLISSCNNDDDILEQAPVEKNLKLSKVTLDGLDKYRFYYDADQLIEFQSDYYTLDTITNESTLNTAAYFLKYSDGLLDKITNDGNDKTYEYLEDDLIIKSFHSQYADAEMTYKNYQDMQNFRVEVFYQTGLETNFNTTFDSDGNYLSASDDSGVGVEDAYPGFYFMGPYYGTYEYNDMNHPYKNFDPEIQLALRQLPSINCVDVITRNNKKIEYKYEFNGDGFPTTSEAFTIYLASNDTIHHGITEYIYE